MSRPLTAEQAAQAAVIALDICELWTVSLDEILGDSRARYIVLARQDLMWRLWSELHLSLPQIGALLNRHHTTVLHAIDKRRFAYRDAS
jgi:chromosomal replication initiation ATPase DnaA